VPSRRRRLSCRSTGLGFRIRQADAAMGIPLKQGHRKDKVDIKTTISRRCKASSYVKMRFNHQAPATSWQSIEEVGGWPFFGGRIWRSPGLPTNTCHPHWGLTVSTRMRRRIKGAVRYRKQNRRWRWCQWPKACHRARACDGKWGTRNVRWQATRIQRQRSKKDDLRQKSD